MGRTVEVILEVGQTTAPLPSGYIPDTANMDGKEMEVLVVGNPESEVVTGIVVAIFGGGEHDERLLVRC